MGSDERFSFEDLDVWQEAVEFADLCLSMVDKIRMSGMHYRLIDQFEDSSASPARNIAEGKGRFSKKEFIHFLYIGRGSLFETATDVELFRRRGWLSDEDCRLLKTRAIRLGKRMNALINAVKRSTESRT